MVLIGRTLYYDTDDQVDDRSHVPWNYDGIDLPHYEG